MEAPAASGSLGIRSSILGARLGRFSDQACSYSPRSSDFCLCQYRHRGVYFTCNIHFQACPCRVCQVGSRKFLVRMLIVQGRVASSLWESPACLCSP